MKIEIYDPAMCCSTGVCGPSVDPELVRIQEALRQIQKQVPEAQVMRYGLTSNPEAFIVNNTVTELLQNEGSKCLPLLFVDGMFILKGQYPGNEQLRLILKNRGFNVSLAEDRKASRCCGPCCC
ncbi:arsenical resistance operon trans-acting repressor ArsD [Geobacter sp. OR-1]|uniref:arsenite efflux transporter metallochaperone ArsD n=1 Tax=Geobacter sp. OR-1 TaxID=1266765 RepID=UPI000541D4CC|nr:arsenite efflux transporter metallochaperone ArsD [Geobacter sp. OR-1]GAM08288.1 arsenical resistance operon trans-acting repressor ArsD [Geobacter sp. OR-1]